jgi:hypothetical protein
VEENDLNAPKPVRKGAQRVVTRNHLTFYLVNTHRVESSDDVNSLIEMIKAGSDKVWRFLIDFYATHIVHPGTKPPSEFALGDPFTAICTRSLALDSRETRELFPQIDKATGVPPSGKQVLDTGKYNFYPRFLCSLLISTPVYFEPKPSASAAAAAAAKK